MKKLVILIVLLLLVGGGGAGWWFFLREPPSEAGAETVYTGPTTGLVEMEPLVVPIIREGQVTLHVTVVVILELAEPMPLTQLTEMRPLMRDALLSELHAVFALRYVRDRGYIFEFVRQRLRQAGDRALGDGAVLAVRIRHFQKRVLATG